VPIALSIVTPSRAVVETEVDSVVAPGSEGEFGVLPGHAPLLAALKPGVVSYTEAGGRTSRVAIGGGFAEVTQERVTVLAPSAESAQQIDPNEAETRLTNALAALDESGVNAPPEEHAKLVEAVARAQARIDVLKQ
jgi:F-type H+-transporting ATPase subunit epsilon